MIDLKPWMLPLVVVALVAPPALGLALLGPQGMVLAAVVVGVVLVIAASLPRPGRRIEVAAGGEGAHHLLVAALAPIDGRALAGPIADRARRGAGGRDREVLVVAPALNPTLDHWAADVAGARRRAQGVLDASIASLRDAGLEARASIGDSNPTLAVEDALREFPADEIVVVEDRDHGLTRELRDRLDRPVTTLSSAGSTSA